MRQSARVGLLALLLVLFFFAGTAAEEPATVRMRYAANDGTDKAVEVEVRKTHQRLNTDIGTDLFRREGHTLYAWNTEPDGSGVPVGLGSRTDRYDSVLYAQWAAWSDESLFQTEGGVITGYTGTEETLVIPSLIRGETIHTIGEGAFRDCTAVTVICPPELRTIAFGAFENAAVETLYLFDSLLSVSDYSFRGCASLRTLHLNAAGLPVYAGTWFSTFADKYDRLLALADRRKIVLFSGSSARFGYDSPAIDAAFPDFEVVNMGVYAYTNALPQMELIRALMRSGDVLLLSPELDAAKRQFCATNALDAVFFNLMEADYDMLAALDLREYTLVFSSLSQYLSIRSSMPGRSWEDSPSAYDEEGEPVGEASYNEYGDYILHRPNAASDKPAVGLEVPYTAAFYRKEQYIDPLNAELARFTDEGILCYLTYSPRNRFALTPESTEEEIRGLDQYFSDTLNIPVISDIRDSLYPGRYMYKTDNHLTTEGAAIRTRQVIRDLTAALEKDGLLPGRTRPGAGWVPAATAALAAAALLAVLFVCFRRKRGRKP